MVTGFLNSEYEKIVHHITYYRIRIRIRTRMSL